MSMIDSNHGVGQIRFLRTKAVQNLLDRAQNDPDAYLALDAQDWRLDQSSADIGAWYIDYPNDILPTSETLWRALRHSKYSPETDASDSLAIYYALRKLTPQQAADQRLWVGLSHFELYKYVRRRWNRHLNNDASKERRVSFIRDHWFGRGVRGLYRDNGVSRLWWMGRIITLISQQSGLSTERVGDLLLKFTDVRANLIERPSTASNVRLAAEITLTLDEYAATEKRIFRRDVFRPWMIEINRLGGTILLDALDLQRLRKFVRTEAEAALKSTD